MDNVVNITDYMEKHSARNICMSCKCNYEVFTYGSPLSFDVSSCWKCPECGEVNNITVTPSGVFYWQDDNNFIEIYIEDGV